MSVLNEAREKFGFKNVWSKGGKRYFEALMVIIKMGGKIRLYTFCCLSFLLFSLRGSENRIFISDKFLVFGNAPLMVRIICKSLLILFSFCNLLFLFIHSNLLFSKTLLLKKNNFC